MHPEVDTLRAGAHDAERGPRPADDRGDAPGVLRIAHVLPSLAIGGQERVALDLARTHRLLGHRIVAYSIFGSPGANLSAEYERAGIPTHLVNRKLRVDPSVVFRLAASFRREGIGIVHTHNPLALTYGALAGKVAGAVVVHTKHGENLEQHGRRLVVRRVVSAFTDAFVAVSPTTAAAARACRDVDERKLQVIPNGIDLTRFGRDAWARGAVRRELGIPQDACVIGTVGRLAPEKNQVALVEALAGALGDRLRLLVVGDGPERDRIVAAAGRAGASRWVVLTGARADVARLLGSFDVFALPSLTEGLPLVVLEAMATGLPVVATRVGGLADVVSDGDTGVLVAPGDVAALRASLLTLATDHASAQALGERGRSVAWARHSLQGMTDAYLQLYHRLLGERGGRARKGRERP